MNRILIYLLFLAFSSGLTAQDNSSYMMVMVKQKKAFRMARTELDYQELANTFERVASAETDQWHPLYYAGLCYVNMSLINKNPEVMDTYLDQAQAFIDQAIAIYPDESEIYVLQALLYQGRIQADREGRSAPFSKRAEEALMVAKDYRSDNPRIYYLLALNQMYTSESEDSQVKACENFTIAEEKFRDFRPDHVLSPTWGGERNHEFYTRFCNQQD
jgi:hypothetical protein